MAEFFLPYGPRGGLMAMVFVSMTFWSLVCVVAFEYARVFQAYDYRTFCRNLLGRGWIIFELTYSVLLIVVLGVIASIGVPFSGIVLPFWGWGRLGSEYRKLGEGVKG